MEPGCDPTDCRGPTAASDDAGAVCAECERIAAGRVRNDRDFHDTDSRDWVTLTIGDSGCGMSQEVQRRAGEPFFSTKEGHAGVGLTIAQLIWRKHRGAFSIESSPGGGTTVRLSILPTGPCSGRRASPARPEA